MISLISLSHSASRVSCPCEEILPNVLPWITNDLGEFRIPDLRAGHYTVIASPPQGLRLLHSEQKKDRKEDVIYTTTYYPGTLEKEEAVAIEVHPGDEVPINFGVLSSPAYRVTGSVSGIPKGVPLAEITLSSKEQGEMQHQQLGQGGTFDFQNVLPGSYNVTLLVVSGLFSSGQQPAMQVMRIPESIEVSNANIEGLRLQPSPGGAVQGHFRMDANEKFDWTQLTVMLFPVDENERFTVGGSFSPPTMSGVNKDGSFYFKNVPGGSYQLVVGAKGNNLRDYFTKSVNLDGRDVADSGFVVSEATLLDVVVSAKGATIQGKVVDATGKPVAYATVVDVPGEEHRGRPDLYQRDVTSEDGLFSLRGLNPGNYTVLAFDDLQDDVRQAEFLKSYQDRGKKVQLDEGARATLVLKVISTDLQGP